MPILKNRAKLTKEEYRKRQREGQRNLRQIKRANGLCGRSGCRKKTGRNGQNHYCFSCAKEDADRKKRYMKIRIEKAAAYDQAFNILSDFKGSTLTERALNARKYYESTEASLI